MHEIDTLLTAAVHHHQAGQLAEAEPLYQKILELEPTHVEALRLLGVLAHQQGQGARALAYLERAVQAAPTEPLLHSTLARVQQALGQHEPARRSFERALALQPGDPILHNQLGVLYHQLGQVDEAIGHYQQALTRQPEYAHAHNNLGLAYQAQAQEEKAAEHFRQALRVQADFVEAHYNLANVLQSQGALEKAKAHYEAALRLRPHHLKVLSNLGNTLLKLGDPAGAVRRYEAALELDEEDALLHNNLGAALQSQGHLEEALHCFRHALHLQPTLVAAQDNIGNLLLDQGKIDEAVSAFQAALRLDPDHVESHINLGAALHKQGRVEAALAHFESALRLQPEHVALRIKAATLLPVIYRDQAEIAQWRQRLCDEVEALLAEGVRLDPLAGNIQSHFLLAYQGQEDRAIVEKIGQLYQPSRDFAPRLRDPAGRKLKIGFLSSYFKSHTIGQLMRGLIAQLDREHFEVSVFSLGFHQDEVNAFIRQHADHYIELPTTVALAAERLAGAELDLLLFTDIGMEPLSYALACLRLAPLQCVTWGHPMTSGLPTIDYFLSSELMEAPGAEAHYSEQLVRLPLLPIYYYPPTPAPHRTRADFDLPDEATLYICPQSLFKFHPDFDPLLGEILRQDPQGQLILIEGSHPHWAELLTQRFRRTIPDVLTRIRFLPAQPRPDFLALLGLADVMLDPLHYGGGNTSYEAFAMGTPVVTLPSPYLRARITLGQYRQMGLSEGLVVEDTVAYIRAALRLGRDPAYRAAVQAKLAAARGVLYENQGAVQAVADFIQGAVQQAWQAQQ